jgi:hypothetical protein
VSGQCGRLKCCLVYEQAAYAELRKGLPKLGKRVIAARGEGRVVEVDVLRQRIRVSYGAGDTEVVPATEVRPLFPSGNQPAVREPEPHGTPEAGDVDELDETVEADDAAEAVEADEVAGADEVAAADGDLGDGLDAMADAVGDSGSPDDISRDSLRDLSPDSSLDAMADAMADASPDDDPSSAS